jgi:ubiquitin-like protein ATG12
MLASTVLTALPRDASSALASAGGFEQERVLVRFRPVGSAPQLKRDVRKISSTQKFEAVVSFLRKTLAIGPGEGLFLYVNSAFAPALDEIVGNLHRVRFGTEPSIAVIYREIESINTDMEGKCFKDSNDHLVVAYSITPAFG